MTTTLQTRYTPCQPFADQRPGTAGLRKKVAVFQQTHYLETFLQAIFNTVQFAPGAVLVAGGDGRYLNRESLQVIAGMAAAHGASRLITGRHGLLSTPAASHLIRRHGAAGGFLLTASHNPGGPDGDFGIKFNVATGGQAPESLTESIYTASRAVTGYTLADLPDLELDEAGERRYGTFTVQVVDSTADYAALMESLFDFQLMADYLQRGHQVCFDALHAVTGPYAHEILCRRLGAPERSILHGTPLPDFGGFHPDPNPVDAKHLIELARQPDAPALIAASDGDGDRNMIVGPGLMLSPCDSIAIMLAHASRIPGYRDGIPGVARSMPTSRAVDSVADALHIPCYETPTGWRYFCNLLEAGMIGLCGEESFGTGSSHVREKDGLWAVLYWLNLLALLDQPLADIVRAHWRRFGRHYYQRQDFFVADGGSAQDLVAALRATLPALAGTQADGATIVAADDFSYTDPVDHSQSLHQGVRISFDDGTRAVYRLSGTGTAGATLRVYLERYENDPSRLHTRLADAIAPLAARAARLARIAEFTGLDTPTAAI